MDTTAVLEAFINVVPDRLADGHIVELGSLGSFRVSVSSKGAREPWDFTPQNFTEWLNERFGSALLRASALASVWVYCCKKRKGS
jgi:hypothetical protein